MLLLVIAKGQTSHSHWLAALGALSIPSNLFLMKERIKGKVLAIVGKNLQIILI
jgi:hypothetical protein